MAEPERAGTFLIGPQKGRGVMGGGPQVAGRWEGLAWPGVGRQGVA